MRSRHFRSTFASRGRPCGGRGRLRRAVVLVAFACCWVVGPLARSESALDAAAALRAVGRFDKALDTLREESRAVKKKEGPDSPSVLPINDLAFEILIDKGDLEAAKALLDKTIALRQKLVDGGKRDHAGDLGDSLLELTRLELQTTRVPEAIVAARRAAVILDGAPERDDAAVARSAKALADCIERLEALLGAGAEKSLQARADAAATFASLGMFSEAIVQRRQILAACLKQDSADEVVDATEQLVRLMMVAGQAAEALPIVEDSLDAIGPEHARETTALRRLLGETQLAADRLVLAEGSCMAVLETTRAEAKPSAVVMAADQLRCLLVALRRGVSDDLPAWFGDAVKVVSRPPLEERAEGLKGLATAGAVLEADGRPQDAADVLSRAVELASAAKAPNAAEVAGLSARLAEAQLLTGSVSAARKTLDRALPAAVRDVGTGDAPVGFLRILMAETLDRQGERDKAAAIATEALVRGLPRPDETWEGSTVAIYDRLAAAGEGDLRERYLAARARQYGAGHQHVATACGLFGAARLAAGDGKKAVEFYRRAADMQRSCLGDDHPEVAASDVLLAHAERVAGDPKRAVESATRGLAAWERIAGPDHPGTLAAVDVLVAAKLDTGDAAGVVELLERLCDAEAVDDPPRRAAHLIRLADMTAARNKERARELLQRAMQLPCWDTGVIGENMRWRLALTAALAAHAFQAAGDGTGATAAVQKARELALQQSDDPKPLLDRIEAIAARGDRPSVRP